MKDFKKWLNENVNEEQIINSVVASAFDNVWDWLSVGEFEEFLALSETEQGEIVDNDIDDWLVNYMNTKDERIASIIERNRDLIVQRLTNQLGSW